MLRIGLTGGIGAGKSTVAAALAELGALVVDADAISREVVAPGTEGLAAVVEEFGDQLLDADGALDRPALASVVFGDGDGDGDGDGEALARLNAILHPRIGARTAELVADAADDTVVVHDVPLLVENGLGIGFALVVVVDAPVDVRLRRLAESRGMSHDQARSRMDAQADDAARREAADVWIDNGGPPGDARKAVAALWRDRIVPFEAGVRAGRVSPWPEAPVDPDPEWPRQGRRLAARVALAGQEWITAVEHVGATTSARPAPDLVELVATTTRRPSASERDALAAAGFPRAGRRLHGSADPARPTRVELRRG